MKQDYNTILSIPYHKAIKYMELYTKYQEEFAKGIKEASKKMKSKTKSSTKKR